MGLILLNNVDVTNLVSLRTGLKNIYSGESSEDLAGETNQDIIKQKRRLSFSCGMLTEAETATILQALDIKALGGAAIDVTYPDMKLGYTTKREFFLDDLSDPEASIVDDETNYTGLAFTLEETGGGLG